MNNNDAHQRKETNLVKVDELNVLCLGQWFLRIHQQVQQGVHTVELIVCNRSHGLLTHRTLVPVTVAMNNA